MPLASGYSKAVVEENIREMYGSGKYSQAQAVAASLGNARRDYRRRHPTGPFPHHLRDTRGGSRNMAKWSHKGLVLTLGRKDTKRWEDGGPDGDSFRRRIREMAHARANSTRRSVEIYASASAGGWMADQIEPEPDDNNRLIATKDRKFAPSERFIAAFSTEGKGETLAGTVHTVYDGPSLSTARVRAKIAASQMRMPVVVMDDKWNTIAVARPDPGAKGFTVVDDKGRVVAHARSREGAHRASRRKNRAGGVKKKPKLLVCRCPAYGHPHMPGGGACPSNRAGAAPSSLRFSSLSGYEAAVRDRLVGKGLPRDAADRAVDQSSARIAMAMNRGKSPNRVADEIFGRVVFARAS